MTLDGADILSAPAGWKSNIDPHASPRSINQRVVSTGAGPEVLADEMTVRTIHTAGKSEHSRATRCSSADLFQEGRQKKPEDATTVHELIQIAESKR